MLSGDPVTSRALLCCAVIKLVDISAFLRHFSTTMIFNNDDDDVVDAPAFSHA